MKNLDVEFAELIGTMIGELYELYQAFLRKEALDESAEQPVDTNDLYDSDSIHEIPW